MDTAGPSKTAQQQMESLCRSTMVTKLQPSSQAAIQGVGSGRIWASCLSCPRMVVLIRDDWHKSTSPRYSGCYNGYALTVCGNCAKKSSVYCGEEVFARLDVWRDMVESSRSYTAVANFCAASGSRKPSYIGDGVQDRRALLQDYVEGVVVKSVQLSKDKDIDTVKISDHVELAVL